MPWHLVCHAPSATAFTPRTIVEVIGEVVGTDAFTPHVTVRVQPGGELRSFFLAWADRSEGFTAFLNHCGDYCRLQVGICAHCVVTFSLYVQTEEVERQFATAGFLAGEPFFVGLLRKLLPEATLAKLEEGREGAAWPIGKVRVLQGGAGSVRNWTLPLRDTQRRSVDWMHAVESAVRGGGTIAYDPCVALAPTVGYDVRTGNLRSMASVPLLEVPYRGAVLANDVGSGKTCCVLRLIAEGTAWDGEGGSGSSSGGSTLVPANSHRDPLMLRSAATVVLCPVGMQQHWQSECRKFAPHLRLVLLTSARELKGLTLESLLDCDLLITTPAYVRSKANTEATDVSIGRALGLDLEERTVRKSIVPASRALGQLPSITRGTYPAALNLVTFRRCIIDEAHDVLGPSSARRERLRACRVVQADVWFGLTATPNLSDAAALQEWAGLLLQFLEEDAGVHPGLAREVERQLIRSFTEEGGTERGTVERTVHRVVLSALERALVESSQDATADTTRVVQLCSSAGAHFHDRVHSVEDVARSLRAAQDETLADLRAAEPSEAVVERIAVVERQRGFVDQIFSQLVRGPEGGDGGDDGGSPTSGPQCPVCFEGTQGVAADAWIALGCGHVLCDGCLQQLPPATQLRKRHCPVCREVITKSMRVAVRTPGAMLRSRGSKLEALVLLVRSILPAKALVVASWKPLLLSAKEALHEADVPAEILEGPAARRGAVLRRFREGEAAALLILSHGAFEGHDLSVASNVIFLHALTGPTDETLRIEHQVLGRVQRSTQNDGSLPVVKVHYLIAADTEEERLWNAQQG